METTLASRIINLTHLSEANTGTKITKVFVAPDLFDTLLGEGGVEELTSAGYKVRPREELDPGTYITM